jgi:hypothetical protein
MPYRKNAAERAANLCTKTTLPRGRANGRSPARACGKAAPFETSSPKSAKQIVRRMRHPPRVLLTAVCHWTQLAASREGVVILILSGFLLD